MDKYYHFEGDFRKKPQQNLAGASAQKNLSRDALLKKAHQERIKREECRKRLFGAVKIQAYVRGFITRVKNKNYERNEFERIMSNNGVLNDFELVLLMRKLLYFYDQKKDSSKLIFLSQQLLKQWSKILQNENCYVQIRRLLALHLKYLNSRGPQSRDSLAVPLRMLEVFTCIKTMNKFLEPQEADIVISKALLYLVKIGYFKEIRKLLEDKTPPLYGPSSSPPTPLAASLLALILRPFSFIIKLNDNEYSNIVMLEFASSILCPETCEVVKLFLLPAIQEQPYAAFPYGNLISCFHVADKYNIKIEYTSWLLYSLLLLDPKSSVCLICDVPSGLKFNFLSHPQTLQYFKLIAQLTSHMLSKSKKNNTKMVINDEFVIEYDSDSDSEDIPINQRKAMISAQCIEMMNNNNNFLLQVCTGQNDWVSEALEQISLICHNLLLSHRMAVHKYKLLSTLAFKPQFLKSLWNWICSLEVDEFNFSNSSKVSSTSTFLLQGLGSQNKCIFSPLTTFCSLYSLLLATMHDEELLDTTTSGSIISNASQAFSFAQLAPLCISLRQKCTGLIEVAFPELRQNIGEGYRNIFGKVGNENCTNCCGETQQEQIIARTHLFKVLVRLLRQLHTRDQRLKFTRGEADWCGGTEGLPLLEEYIHLPLQAGRYQCLTNLSHVSFNALTSMNKKDWDKGPPLTTREKRTLTILKEIPFVVPFSRRVIIFQGMMLKIKEDYQGDLANFLQGPSIELMIRRSHIYEDAFVKLSSQNEPDLRLKMRVQLMNEAGLEEAGVDGGGVFREFLSELLRTACDPNRGFFRLTADNMLYPNPAVHMLVENFHHHYYFIGRILGKALYEGLLVDLPFAEFFLQAVVGEEHSGEGEADIHRLAALDERLHRSLLQLRTMPAAAVSDLGLDFTVMSDELGEQRMEELKPSGANIPVTAENRIEYIHLVAEWKLSRQVQLQVSAIRQGLATVISLAWLRMFCARELCLLISGTESPVDINDLKNNTNYAGGYCADHPTIKIFWKVIENFNDIQKRQLLKFVTSCSRPPLLGFKDLEPPFCIQSAGTSEHLPTASTCMNLLKLPEFSSEVVMCEKILYAINAGAGFELS